MTEDAIIITISVIVSFVLTVLWVIVRTHPLDEDEE